MSIWACEVGSKTCQCLSIAYSSALEGLLSSPSYSRYLKRVLMTDVRRSGPTLCTILRARTSHAVATQRSGQCRTGRDILMLDRPRPMFSSQSAMLRWASLRRNVKPPGNSNNYSGKPYEGLASMEQGERKSLYVVASRRYVCGNDCDAGRPSSVNLSMPEHHLWPPIVTKTSSELWFGCSFC